MAERSHGKFLVVVALALALVVAPSARVRHAAAGTIRPAASTNASLSARMSISPGSEILWESDAQLARDLDAIAGSGAGRTGFDFDWASIQGDGPSSFWWVATDRVVLAARKRGLVVGGGLVYSPPWAQSADCPRGTTHCLPTNVADFARFADAAARRYGANSPDPQLRGTVEEWNIWNEPNNGEFAQPKPDPAKYTALLKAGYAAIKAADPGATVITGGTAPAGDAADGSEISPSTWLIDLYLNGAQGSFDAVGHHPYSFPTNPLEDHPWNAFTQTMALHVVMTYFGDGDKKIWGTEVGAPTGTDPVALTDAQQAQWLHDYYLGWNTTFASFTGPLSWFSHRDSGTNRAHWWDNMGLLRNDGTPKPAYTAFQEAAGAANSSFVASYSGTRTAANPQGGYYVLGATGAIQAIGGAPYYGAPSLPFGLARGMAVMPDGHGYVVLDAFGGVHRYGTARSGAVGRAAMPYWPGWSVARDVAITPSGQGIAVLDSFGGLHVSGDAPHLRPGYWPGWDIARAFAFSPSGAGVYVLDGFGGVHVAGDAVAHRGPYWPAWDIARDIHVTESGDGYTVLDGFGNIHVTGDAPAPGWNPAYAPFDHAGGVTQVGKSYVIAA